MIKNNTKFIEYIKNLKAMGAKAFKLELESEYLKESSIQEISEILKQNSLYLALKLCGFSSYNDILISKNVKADIITAPMIETPYAFKKFIETLLSVYSLDEISNKEIFINIETLTGIQNLDAVLNSKHLKLLTGIVIGRGDLISSLDIEDSLIDSPKIEKIITPVIQKCEKAAKKVIIGGKITSKSTEFLKGLPLSAVSGFETRKILFSKTAIQDKNLKSIIDKAIEFEIYYLETLLNTQNQNSINIKERIKTLRERF